MIYSAEDFERHTIAALQATLPAALNAVYAAYLAQDQADGLTDADGASLVQLPAPAADAYWPGGVDVATSWPGIEVAVPRLELANYALGQVDADATVTLMLQVWLRDARYPVLTRLMKRYSVAVYDCLRAPGALGDASINTARLTYLTNPEAPDENLRTQGTTFMTLELETGQTRAS